LKPLRSQAALLNMASFRSLKNVLLLTAGTFLFSVSATAQKKTNTVHKSATPFWNHFDIGINGGLSVNKFVSGQPQTGLNTGYTAGAFINYKAYKGFGLQLEVNNLQQGGQLIRFKDDTRLGLAESFQTKNVKNSSYHLNSLEIPLLINYTFNLKQTWRPVVYAGASYAYTYNVTEHYQKTGDLLTGEDIIATVNDTQTATSYFNSSRLNLIVGASAQLPLTSKLSLLVDFRYLNGVTPAREGYSYMEKLGFGSDVRTNSFITRIGLLMPLGKK
jgi:hypothetical protein